MPTLVLDLYTTEYPTITNRIKVSLYSETDPLALVASLIDATAGHPARWWHFPGLPRNNYRVLTTEINAGGANVNTIADFNVVPGEIEGTLNRDDEQIQVGITPGFVQFTNNFVFDGTAGKPDYRGWSIVPSELTGRGILDIGLDYSWDSVTGTFQLLQFPDMFPPNQVYNIHFNPQSQPAGNSYPTLLDFGIDLISVSTVLTPDRFGRKVIAEPGDHYIELTLPTIASVVQGRPLMIEVSGISHCCVRVKANGADVIKFLKGNIYAAQHETFIVYKFIRPGGTMEWRVAQADGNFKTVGQIVSDDGEFGDVINRIPLDGSSVLVTQYARLYNEVVLNLPIAQVVNYDSWATGNNKYLFSLANSSNPANAGKFMIPDRRGLFERATTAATKPGDYQDSQNQQHNHYIQTGGDNNLDDNADGYIHGRSNDDGRANPADMTNPITWNMTKHFTTLSGGTESRPTNYSINKFVLI